MLPESQARILRLLARYPEELAQAWDVPRELSLPGLSESLGLVRSALHEPIKALEEEGLVQTRNAHVIGGGNRKRSVVHLTSKGRQQASALVTTAGHSMEIDYGDGLHGRESELEQIESALAKGAVVLTGMPGIGKTALLQTLSSTRYVTMDASMDAKMLAEAWLEMDDAPIDLEAQMELLSVVSETLVVDEVQDVHPRHQSGVHALLNGLVDAKAQVAIGMRAPCPFDNVITLTGIDAEAGQKLLGGDVDSEVASDVCEALDGHPLALHLWSPSDDLPEASDAVQAFVEETVLSRLADGERDNLDTLCAEPRPVLAAHLDAIDIDPLDDAGLLRWPNGRVEVQHLIRNVR
ncbi:MAG: helix-turn-helix domain-containing protein, partial [Candidatus Thalassarchaeaceae archaeon]|nr:helix-turn-helix domain-containing protein [Candidatus Thalassarchaeaceae archaeon]